MYIRTSRVQSRGDKFQLPINIKYLAWTWHSADFILTAILEGKRRRKHIYICIWQSLGKLPPQPKNTRAPRLQSVCVCVCAPNENINPASHYSGSAVGQATWQSSHAPCRIWSVILYSLLTADWGIVLTQSLWTSKQNYNVPTVRKRRGPGIE